MSDIEIHLIKNSKNPRKIRELLSIIFEHSTKEDYDKILEYIKKTIVHPNFLIAQIDLDNPYAVAAKILTKYHNDK